MSERRFPPLTRLRSILPAKSFGLTAAAHRAHAARRETVPHGDTAGKLFAITLLAAALGAPAFAFDPRPNPNLTSGSVRINGHDVSATCRHLKAHRGPTSYARRDEVLTEYGLPPGDHPDHEIDHLIPLCLGGSDDRSNQWPEPRHSIEPRQWRFLVPLGLPSS
jgi:hypothetical protein